MEKPNGDRAGFVTTEFEVLTFELRARKLFVSELKQIKLVLDDVLHVNFRFEMKIN